GTAIAVGAGGHLWLDFVLVPLAASVSHHLVELLGTQYVETQREAARDRQLALMNQHISTPMAEWFTQWPATGGSHYERLNTVLRRFPAAMRELNQVVTQTLEGK